MATVIHAPTDADNIPERTELDHARLIFREDSYDPVTRIRRGRFYNRGDGVQPQEWRVQRHPALQEEGARDSEGCLVKRLFGFYIWAARIHLGTSRGTLVALGIRDAMTLWSVIGVEQISTGEDLVTLKARSNLGTLPDLAEEAVPFASRARVRECLNKLADTVYKVGPESVIDRCRDASVALLGTWLEPTHPGANKKDLGVLASWVAGSAEKAVLENAAKIIARLHARAKPNEQVTYGTRLLEESDASLAVECVGLIMREVGWAKEQGSP